MEDEITVSVEAQGLPSFAKAGLFILVLAVVIWTGLYLFTPSSLPDPPSADTLNLNEYRKSLEAAQRSIQFRSLGMWIADKAISGGFLMWLAGAAVCALRHSNQR